MNQALSRNAFTAAPHRMLFFAGAVQLLAVMLLWLSELLGRQFNFVTPLSFTAPAAWAHLFLMLYGLFPFFIFGFLLTVYPRWMNGPVVPRRLYISIFGFLAGGMLLFYTGLFLSRTLMLVALAFILAGWATALFTLLRVYFTAGNRGRHEIILNLALTAGIIGIGFYFHAIASGSPFSLLLAREIGLWLFLAPVVFSVGHRMIPFFSNIVLPDYVPVRPPWSLPLMGACVIGHAALAVSGQIQWLFVFDLPLFLTALHHSLAWGIRRSFAVPLLAMLHIAFAWLAATMALYCIQSLALLVADAAILGRAPLHALGIGFITGMVVAMASRVTLGHSGRPLMADRSTWYIFLGINASAAVRVGAELVGGTGQYGNIIAALIWLTGMALWVGCYAPIYLRPRVDGRPG